VVFERLTGLGFLAQRRVSRAAGAVNIDRHRIGLGLAVSASTLDDVFVEQG
jgi:hypothetical protein